MRRERELDPQSRKSGWILVPPPDRHRPAAPHLHPQQTVRARERDGDGRQYRRSRVALPFRHRGRAGLRMAVWWSCERASSSTVRRSRTAQSLTPINAGDEAAGLGIAQMRIFHFRGLEDALQDSLEGRRADPPLDEEHSLGAVALEGQRKGAERLR